MRIAFFDTHRFEREIFQSELRRYGTAHRISFLDARLSADTAILAEGHDCVCSFVNDSVDRRTVGSLAGLRVRLLALRCAGFNHVDLAACREFNLPVVRVPAYSPFAVAEHAAALILSLNRKIHRAYNRVRELNFSLEGLIGFDLHGKTVGVIGTGSIGSAFAKIMRGFGCEVLAYDPNEQTELAEKLGITYVPLAELLKHSDIISIHCPLIAATRHLIDSHAIAQMKRGVMLINTGRGALIDTSALLEALKCGRVGSAGLDVYEEEEGIFFHDFSDSVLSDDRLGRLLSFPNVIITAHQGFLTTEALQNIAATTLKNISEFEENGEIRNVVNFESSVTETRCCI